MKRVLAWMLVAAMLAGVLVSCGEKAETENGADLNADTASTVETETEAETTELEARQAVSDDLPENDFGGRDFIVISSDGVNEAYIAVEEQTGEGVNDAVFARNLTVNERFNANVVYTDGGAHRDCAKYVETAITAGDTDAFQLIQFHVVSNSGNAMKGLYLNWYDLPYVDFEKPWWSTSNRDDLTINNRCYLAMGDFALSTIAKTYCMFYDKDALKQYPEETDLYTIVKDGKWTLDYLRALCERVYIDRDGDGVVSDGDYYGLYSDQQSNYNTYLWSCDNPVFKKDASGELIYSYYSEHLVDVYNKCYELFNNTIGARSEMDHSIGMTRFAEYKSLTCNGLIGGAITHLAEYDNEYGIIPFPKYDETQKDYKTMVDGSHEAMAVGKQAADLDFIGTMTEALCAESYKQVVPAYYDVCLKQRYASSPEDAEMIDLCVASRVFDLGYVYDNWNGVSFIFQELLRAKTKQDITSYYAEKEKAATTYYDKVIALFYTEE